MRLPSITWDHPLSQAYAAAQATTLNMDDEAFAAFYQRTARPLWAYLARVSGNAALADDLLQETYLRFLGATLRDDGEVAQRRYLFRIATNLMRDHWRKPATSALDELVESAQPTVDMHISEQLESHAALSAALVRMKPRERQLLWLAYAEGASHKEIAEITGLGATSIRLLLFRARKKMARFLRQQGWAGAS